jgi:serine/threonine-protein kinase
VLAPVSEPEPRRRRRWPWFLIGGLALALAALLIFLAVSGLLAAETREVPRVVGKQLVEARAILERAGFEAAETRVQSELPFDQVLDQDPDAGQEAEEGSTVVIEVSGGPGTVRVPSISGLPVRQAVDELEDRGLKANLARRPSESVAEGLAIRSVPGAGEVVERGETVKVFISSGPEQVQVPDVTGLSRESAEARIGDAGLVPDVQEQESEEPEGDVVAQDPAGGTQVERGATVTLTVSTGIETVDVSNVLGLSAGDAAGQLRADGLQPVQDEREVTDSAQDGKVVDQRPAPGTEVERGRQVVIIIGVLVEEDVITPGEEPGGTP